MKHFLSIMMFVCLVGFFGCSAGGTRRNASSQQIEATIDNEASYALGMILATNLMLDEFIPNIDELFQGMEDVLYDSRTRYSRERAQQIIELAFDKLVEQRDEVFRLEEYEFLAENSKKSGINITDSGLQYEVIIQGDGPQPGIFDSVLVHYEGALTNGTVFDSSYSRGEPIQFPLMRVIPGWTEGLQLMGVGSKYRLFIPSDLGYGPQGAPPQIPPYSTLVFEVELLDIIHEE